MDLENLGYEGVNWTRCSVQGLVAETFEHGNELYGSIRGGEFLD
jgi:hypothetical protein